MRFILAQHTHLESALDHSRTRLSDQNVGLRILICRLPDSSGEARPVAGVLEQHVKPTCRASCCCCCRCFRASTPPSPRALLPSVIPLVASVPLEIFITLHQILKSMHSIPIWGWGGGDANSRMWMCSLCSCCQTDPFLFFFKFLALHSSSQTHLQIAAHFMPWGENHPQVKKKTKPQSPGSSTRRHTSNLLGRLGFNKT